MGGSQSSSASSSINDSSKLSTENNINGYVVTKNTNNDSDDGNKVVYVETHKTTIKSKNYHYDESKFSQCEGVFGADGKIAEGKCYDWKNAYHVGSFRNELLHGVGLIKSKDESKSGEFVDGKLVKGEYDLLDENIKMKGTFIDEKLNGKGEYTKNIYDDDENITYECVGQFKNNKLEGDGKILYNQYIEGDHVKTTYEGMFTNGKLNGKGMIHGGIWADWGKRYDYMYEGSFVDNYLHGNGCVVAGDCEVVTMDVEKKVMDVEKEGYFQFGRLIHGKKKNKNSVINVNGGESIDKYINAYIDELSRLGW